MWLLLSLVATRCVQGLLPPISGRKHAYALKKVKMSASIDVDIAVIGSGIAGTTISWLLREQQNCSVALIDPKVNTKGAWYPNYGEWRDEWHVLSDRLKLPELKDCTTTEWESTECFFGGSYDIPDEQRTLLDRPYVRVDRVKMQELLRQRYLDAGGLTLPSKLLSSRMSQNIFDKDLVHTANASLLVLENGQSVRCRVLIDASGLESRLVAKEEPMLARGVDKELSTGFQIAYGFIGHVNSLGPYNSLAMTLFDYRTDHYTATSPNYADAIDRPTFMYAMPLRELEDGTHLVFFEETSLVGKGPRRLSFEECKKRAYDRLAFHDIQVLGVEEEEYCYIPMGGELPDLTQRVIGFGGAANMVHPSTGYHACRMLAASTDVAQIVGDGIRKGASSDFIASSAYRTIWSQQNRGQRDFQAYGGDFLMEQPVKNLRGFFSSFFKCKQPVWSGFLAGWPGLPGNEYHENWSSRLSFALEMFVNMPNDVRFAMVFYSIQYTIRYGPNTLLRSLTPSFFFGAGPADRLYEDLPETLGDVEAKLEARTMMKEFRPTAKVTYNKKTTEEEVVRDESTLVLFPAPFNS